MNLLKINSIVINLDTVTSVEGGLEKDAVRFTFTDGNSRVLESDEAKHAWTYLCEIAREAKPKKPSTLRAEPFRLR
jgi:hypothetical protein